MNSMNLSVAHRQLAIFLFIAGLICVIPSCRSTSRVEEPVSDKQSAAAYIAQADQYYAGREDLANVRRGIVALRQARIVDSSNYDAAWRLAKFDNYLATRTDSTSVRDEAFREGIEAGKAAVKLQGDRPEGHFWLGANYGRSAEAGLLLATVPDIRNEMESVIRLDEGYQDGSAYMVLGLVYLKAPSLLGGNKQMAVEEMEKGLRFGENNTLLRLYLAEAYQAVGRKEDARKQLNAILSMTPPPDYLPEYKEASTEARRLLDET
jgi:tetratricopeptide (TPR) repeat protein